MDSAYFRNLAARCLGAARHSFDLDAIGEFRELADEFVRKAEELERIDPPIVMTKGRAVKREREGKRVC